MPGVSKCLTRAEITSCSARLRAPVPLLHDKVPPSEWPTTRPVPVTGSAVDPGIWYNSDTAQAE